MSAQARIEWKFEGKFSAYLDFMRWAAAMVVVISHIKGLFFADYSQLEHPNLLWKIVYAVASAGHQAVMVFFVLSGLFISANVMKAIGKRKWSWGAYFANRLTRLYIVLIPALLLGFLWDYAGNRLFGQTGIYMGLPEDKFVLDFSTLDHANTETFIGNLFFLQGIAVGHYGSNGPLWSLSYELWYYLLFPCMILTLSSRTKLKKLAYLLLSAAIALLVGPKILLYFLVWMLGFVIHLLPAVSVRAAKAGLLPALVLSVASIVFYRMIPLPAFAADLVVACLFTLLIYFMKIGMGAEKPQLRAAAGAKFLAGFSYTAYLVHFPPLVFIHAMFYSRHPVKWQPDAVTSGYALVLWLGIVAYCWFISFFTERQTDKVRGWISPLVEKRKAGLAKKGGKMLES